MLKALFRLVIRLAVLTALFVAGRRALQRWVDGPEPKASPVPWPPLDTQARAVPDAPAPDIPARGAATGGGGPGLVPPDEPADPVDLSEATPEPAGHPAPTEEPAQPTEPARRPEPTDEPAEPTGATEPTDEPAEPTGATDEPAAEARDATDEPTRPSSRASARIRTDGSGGARGGPTDSGRTVAARTRVQTEPTPAGDDQTWVPPGPDGEIPESHPVKAKLGSRTYREPGSSGYERARPDRCYPSAEAAEADGFTRARR